MMSKKGVGTVLVVLGLLLFLSPATALMLYFMVAGFSPDMLVGLIFPILFLVMTLVMMFVGIWLIRKDNSERSAMQRNFVPMTCPMCGGWVTMEQSFCSACGARLGFSIDMKADQPGNR
jgi:hypothetical protein